jgi:hypothetical protein
MWDVTARITYRQHCVAEIMTNQKTRNPSILTAEVIAPNMDSGIRPAFFRMRSSDPPSIYSMQILISPSLKEHNYSADPGIASKHQ